MSNTSLFKSIFYAQLLNLIFLELFPDLKQLNCFKLYGDAKPTKLVSCKFGN